MFKYQKKGLSKALTMLLAVVMLLTAPIGTTQAYALEGGQLAVTDSQGEVSLGTSDGTQPSGVADSGTPPETPAPRTDSDAPEPTPLDVEETGLEHNPAAPSDASAMQSRAGLYRSPDIFVVKTMEELSTVLNNLVDGDVIRLSNNIDYTTNLMAVSIHNKVTFDLSTYTLNITSTQNDGTGLVVGSGGDVSLQYSTGKLNVSGGRYGLQVLGGPEFAQAMVTNATARNAGGAGISAVGDANAVALGNVSSYGAGAHASGIGSTVLVHGEISARTFGAHSQSGGKITTNQGVTQIGEDGTGAYISGSEAGSIMIGGNIQAKDYIRFDDTFIAKGGGVADPSKPEYTKYTNGDRVVWVKGVIVSDDNVCEVDGVQYATFNEALATVQSGETIKLLKAIIHTDPVVIDNKAVTFNLNGFSLTIDTSAVLYSIALDVKNSGSVSCTGDGYLDVKGQTCGVQANNGTVTVRHTTSTTGAGAFAVKGGQITITGDVIGKTTGVSALNEGSKINVTGNVATAMGEAVEVAFGGQVIVSGNVSATANSARGVYASSPNTQVYIGGDVKATQIGVDACDSAQVIVDGNVSADGTGIQAYGVRAQSNSKIKVHGNVSANPLAAESIGAVSIGTTVGTKTEITIDGTVSGMKYIRLGNLVRTEADKETVTTLSGYHTFTHTDTGGTHTIWIKDSTATGEKSHDAKLYSLSYSINEGEPIPITTFQNWIQTYRIDLPVGTPANARIKLTGVTNHAAATMNLNNSAITLMGGEGRPYIMVRAEDGVSNAGYYVNFFAPYKIEVIGGTSNEEWSVKNNSVTVTAAIPEGKAFDKWTATGITLTAEQQVKNPLTFYMPGKTDISLTAHYQELPEGSYTVTVISGSGDGTGATGAGSYIKDTTVYIYAGNRSGYSFNGWTSSDVTITNAGNKSASFTMPWKNVSVTANWKYNGGGNSGGNDGGSSSGGSSSGGSSSGGSDSGSSTVITTTPEKKPNQPVMATAQVTATARKNSSASAVIPEKAVTAAITKAQADAKAQGKTANGISVGVNITRPKEATTLTVILKRNSLNSLVNAGVISLSINGSDVTVTFDKKALAEIQKQSSGNISITIAMKTNLTAGAKKIIGTRPMYDITVGFTKGGKNAEVSSFGGGTVTVSIPYTLRKNEVAGGLYAVYVDEKGNATRIAGSAYDTNSGDVLFTTTHFSLYGVGYTAPSTKFTDISTHWGKENIDYVVGRGILSGTTDITFAPNNAMTQGILVTALGRLAGVDVSDYKTVSFTDTAADKYYAPYLEWAYKNGIVSGIGNSQFASDRAITREEIALILDNYAKATGYTLPVTREAADFADDSGIGSTYKDAVKAMQQAGIMMGGDGNKFNPEVSATRAEVSAMLHRYIKLTIDPATSQGWAVNDAGQRLYYKDGKALTGWQDIGSGDSKKHYYFTKDAIMVSAKWLMIGNKWYYFNTDGSLAVSAKVDGYEVDENGVRKPK